MLGGTICELSEMSSRSRIQRWRRLAGTTLRLWSLRLSLVTRYKDVNIFGYMSDYITVSETFMWMQCLKKVFKKFGKFTKKTSLPESFFLDKVTG